MDDTTSSKRIWIGLLTFAGLIAASLLAYVFVWSQSDKALYKKAYGLIQENRFEEADRISKILLEREENAASLILAADVARLDDRVEDAIRFYLKLPFEATDDFVQHNLIAGSLALEINRASLAETFFRNVLKIQRRHKDASRELGLLLMLGGRRWEASKYLFELVRQRDYTIRQLIMVGDLEQPFNFPDDIEVLRDADPDDKVLLLGLARFAIDTEDYEKAERLLREVIEFEPENSTAQAWLGWLLAEKDDDFVKWNRNLPPQAEEHPVVWTARGNWAAKQMRSDEAIRCFWEAVRRDPNNRIANQRLGELLLEHGSADDAKVFSDRAEKLQRLNNILVPILARSDDEKKFKGHSDKLVEVADVMESLGRLWETHAWIAVAASIESDEEAPTWAMKRIDALKPQLTQNLPPVVASANPANQVDLSTFPLPSWNEMAKDAPAK